MTVDEFVNKYNGKKIDFDNFYGGQCVDLYRQYVAEVFGFPQSPGVGGATEIWDTASPQYYDFIKNTPDGIPTKGDIVIWNRRVGGGFGHVAVFLEGNTDQFVSFDQNWRALNVCERTTHNYTNVIGWLHPKGDDMPSDELKELKEKLAWYEKEYPLEQQRVADARKERDDALAQVENLKNEMAKLREDAKRDIGAAKDEAKKQKEALNELVVFFASNLGTTQDVPKIKAEIVRLIDIEDQLTKCRSDKDDVQKEVQELRSVISTHIEEASRLSGRSLGTLEAVLSYIDELVQSEQHKTLRDYPWIERFKSLFGL